ncbi:unnamed protein product [Chrysodeixis includens]|uniref:Uncharacterized protein n=1 Tax=Chrysodeixis includens TaxID=689277 RepID=A0A9P0G0R8_CHRIL|nr:unnamed protein product [Chrysodeixis includens]
MTALPIVFALLAVGKIHCRGIDVSQVSNFRPSVPVTDQRIPHREYSEPRTPQPPRLYTNAPRPPTRQHPQIYDGSVNLNLPQLTVTEKQQKRKLYVNMNRPLDNTVNDTFEQKNSEDLNYNKTFETNDNIFTSKPAKVSVDSEMANSNTMKTALISENEIEVPPRSSFVGDECPKGYVKVQGQCVKAD